VISQRLAAGPPAQANFATHQQADDTCPIPITQAEIGDALGLSTVHVNRTFQTCGLIASSAREAGCSSSRTGKLSTSRGGFDPTCLHVKQKAA
jgi:hypothetical protein